MTIRFGAGKAKVPKDLRQHVERRLGFALGRFGEQVGRVIVRFPDTTDNTDKRCRIEVGLRPEVVRVEDRDTDFFVAVDHAARRVARSVARVLERQRKWEERGVQM